MINMRDNKIRAAFTAQYQAEDRFRKAAPGWPEFESMPSTAKLEELAEASAALATANRDLLDAFREKIHRG
jgi:hypothetical protein